MAWNDTGLTGPLTPTVSHYKVLQFSFDEVSDAAVCVCVSVGFTSFLVTDKLKLFLTQFSFFHFFSSDHVRFRLPVFVIFPLISSVAGSECAKHNTHNKCYQTNLTKSRDNKSLSSSATAVCIVLRFGEIKCGALVDWGHSIDHWSSEEKQRIKCQLMAYSARPYGNSGLRSRSDDDDEEESTTKTTIITKLPRITKVKESKSNELTANSRQQQIRIVCYLWTYHRASLNETANRLTCVDLGWWGRLWVADNAWKSVNEIKYTGARKCENNADEDDTENRDREEGEKS